MLTNEQILFSLWAFKNNLSKAVIEFVYNKSLRALDLDGLQPIINQQFPGKFDKSAFGALKVQFAQFETTLSQSKIKVLTRHDNAFPRQLTSIDNCPAVLFVRGNEQLLAMPQVAVIGTRSPSHYGVEASRRIGKTLVENGLVVTSGLAIGCDTAAHQGALAGNGATIAVMAGGLDSIYPNENRKLSEDILANGGALVSEYFPGERPQRSYFVQRNRIQSGLSQAVIVIESALKGGTMHTAEFARKQGRLLATIQHSQDFKIKYPTADNHGNINLVQQGAFPVAKNEDLIALMGQIKKKNQLNTPIIFQPNANKRKRSDEGLLISADETASKRAITNVSSSSGAESHEFYGRTAMLEKLRRFFSSSQPCLSILGAPGIGKTALFKHFITIEKSLLNYSFYWLDGTSPASFIYSMLSYTEFQSLEDCEFEIGSQRFRQALTSIDAKKSIFIIDNIQTKAELLTMWPNINEETNLRMVIISRDRQCLFQEQILIEPDATLLAEHTNMIQHALNCSLSDAQNLIIQFNYCTLALKQSIHYIKQLKLNVTDYLSKIKSRVLSINQLPGIVSSDYTYKQNIATVYVLALDEIYQQEAYSKRVLTTFLVLDGSAVRIDWLASLLDLTNEKMLSWCELAAGLGLLEWKDNTKTIVGMPSLCREILSTQQQDDLSSIALELLTKIAAKFPNDFNFVDLETIRHAVVLTQRLDPEVSFVQMPIIKLIYQLGVFFRVKSNATKEARHLLELAQMFYFLCDQKEPNLLKQIQTHIARSFLSDAMLDEAQLILNKLNLGGDTELKQKIDVDMFLYQLRKMPLKPDSWSIQVPNNINSPGEVGRAYHYLAQFFVRNYKLLGNLLKTKHKQLEDRPKFQQRVIQAIRAEIDLIESQLMICEQKTIDNFNRALESKLKLTHKVEACRTLKYLASFEYDSRKHKESSIHHVHDFFNLIHSELLTIEPGIRYSALRLLKELVLNESYLLSKDDRLAISQTIIDKEKAWVICQYGENSHEFHNLYIERKSKQPDIHRYFKPRDTAAHNSQSSSSSSHAAVYK